MDLPSDPVERILERLRDEWKRNCPAGPIFKLARNEVSRLQTRAATHQAALALGAIEADLVAYQELPIQRRRAELPRIANALKELKPLLTEPAEPPTPFGKLPSAIAPVKRKQPRAERTVEPVSSLVLKPDEPVTKLPKVGPANAKKLANLGAAEVGDLLRLAPRRHIDYSQTTRIGAALATAINADVTVRGEVTRLDLIRGPGTPRVVIQLADESGSLRVTWFNQYVANQLRVGDRIAVSGKLEAGYGGLSFTSPEWELMSGPGGQTLSTGRLIPVYPLTHGLAQKTLRRLTRAALDATKTTIEDYLPERILNASEEHLLDLATAYEQLHYPDQQRDNVRARRRLAFDGLFLVQLGLTRRKQERQAFGAQPLSVDRKLVAQFHQSLPFRLTGAQETAITEILHDIAQAKPMNRLLQGDVGSGKTVVAATALLVAHANGLQGAMMAPTEILAEQHDQNLRSLFSVLPEEARPRVALLTGSTPAAARKKILAGCASGEITLLVGTHALIQGTVAFARLGLAVVDEQHRFGVRQRAELPDKATGNLPHQLSMTATPIPRSLNMVLHGDLDVSVIDERPPGRIPITTRRYVGTERDRAYALVREEVAAGRQVFVICPLVEASEKIEAKAAVDEAARLQAEVFPELRIATLHGRMSGREKDAIMTAFRQREYDLLVSTSVIEVGIDIPNATVMMVEGADRFGLAQLHQFRGRVGRGSAQSYCLLLADESTPDGEERLAMMEATDDGFALAEKDLELRGPGDFIGTRQSGLPELSWLAATFDTRLFDRARQAAEETLARDPDLALPEHRALAARLTAFWAQASPDVPL
jgi:ATP-dependent DNA helicase RecG